MLEQRGDPVQLQYMLFPHVVLQLVNAVMRLQVANGGVASSNCRWNRTLHLQ